MRHALALPLHWAALLVMIIGSALSLIACALDGHA